jgi:EmrB/QacA subfamily drug resistance transporter
MSRRLLLAALVLSSALTSLPTTALVLALPTLHHDFHASLSELQWTMTAYSLAYASFLVVGGRLADLRGRRRFFLLGVAIWIAATLAAGAATNATTLIVAMGLLGIGSAALTPASLALLTNLRGGVAERTRAISVWAAASAVMSGVGPTLGGILTDDFSWRWIFWLSAAAAVVTFGLTLAARAPESRNADEQSVDVPGVVLLCVGLTTVTLALIQGPEWEFDSLRTLLTFGVGAAVLVWFVFVERRTRAPLLELDLFRVPVFVGGVIVKLGVNFATAAFFIFMSLYLQEILGYSPETAGFALLPLSVTFLAALPAGTRLGLHFGPRVPILAGLTLAIAAFLILSSLDKDMTYADLAPAILLLGLGLGFVVTPMNAAPLQAIEPSRHGAAAGILQTTTGLGSVLGIALGGALFQEAHERRLTDFLDASGRAISESTQHDLSGILVHSPPAERALARFDAETGDAILHGIREAFVYGISTTMWLSAGALCAGGAAAMVLMRRSGLSSSSGTG